MKNDFQNPTPTPDGLQEPQAEYRTTTDIETSNHIREDIRIGIKQANDGKLIPFHAVMARYR